MKLIDTLFENEEDKLRKKIKTVYGVLKSGVFKVGSKSGLTKIRYNLPDEYELSSTWGSHPETFIKIRRSGISYIDLSTNEKPWMSAYEHNVFQTEIEDRFWNFFIKVLFVQ